MKAKNVIFIMLVSILMLFATNLRAQIGTGENVQSSRNVQQQNAQRLSILEQQLDDAKRIYRDARKDEQDAKKALREAKSAVKSEKHAQKARKKANTQAKKAEDAVY
jgi:hypothetical protein